MTDATIEQTAAETPTPGGDFGSMLEDFSFDMPKRGQVLEGTLLSVSEDEVIVDVGMKRDAFVPRQDLERLPAEVRNELKAGQDIKVAVLRAYDREGELIVSINKALAEKDWERAVECLEEGTLLEATVVDVNKGGVLARFGQLRGFLPQSHIISLPRGGSNARRAEQMEAMVGTTIPVKIIEITRERNRLIFSERAAHQEALQQTLESLEPGSIVSGHVVHIKNYGAFVDIGNNVTGLVHVSDLDWTRVEHPSDVVKVGDELELKISRVDVERGRVSLDRKSQLPNPWQTITERYSEGDLITGRVSNVTDFGLFVELPGGLDGLVHVSQLSSYGATHPGELAKRGDLLPVRILRIDEQRERIALSLDAVTTEEQLEWMEDHYDDEEEAREPVAVAIESLEDAAMEDEAPAADAEAPAEAEAESVAEAEVEMPTADAEAPAEAEAESVEEVEAEAEIETPAAEAEAEIEMAEAPAADAEAEVEMLEAPVEAEEEAEEADTPAEAPTDEAAEANDPESADEANETE